MGRIRIGASVFLALFGFAASMAGLPNHVQAGDCAAIIYEHGNYQGKAQCLQVGQYNINRIQIGNDTLSSIKVGNGHTVHLFEHANFNGAKLTLRTSGNVSPQWNDRVSSIIVE